MTPHEQRVIDEKAALDEKIAKLAAFFPTTIYDSLCRRDQDLMREQYSAMMNYSDILGNRIARFRP